MALPIHLVLIDTSAAIEVLVPEATCHTGYTRMLQTVRRSGMGLAVSELLAPELVEAAYTWDARREYPRTWRALRQRRALIRPRARELTILAQWERVLHDFPHVLVPIADVMDASVKIVHETGIGSYDAVHLAAAAHVGASIMTHDRGMIAAIRDGSGLFTQREIVR